MRARIRAKRKKLGMSQVQLAERIGISRVAVCEFESGRGSLSDATVEKMLDVLDIGTMQRARYHMSEFARLAARL
jgi:transcriptional regulator with XRE-family HTH domain